MIFPAQDRSKLGFIGIGAMGLRIAGRLLKQGFPVTVFDRNFAKAKALIESGGIAARSIGLLEKGKIEKLVLSLRSIDADNPDVAEKIRTEADYFARNAERMRYPQFRRQHLFVGSGVIEAGCKTVIGSRLKRSGMFWTVRGANAILALRCCHLNRRFEDYWEGRRAA